MTMKSQFYSAYVAGLCPHQLLLSYRPEHPRESEPAPIDAQTRADSSRAASRRKRAVLFVLTLSLAIGAWQLLSRTGQAAELAAQDSAAQTSAACA
jgi:hypothetical protein